MNNKIKVLIAFLFVVLLSYCSTADKSPDIIDTSTQLEEPELITPLNNASNQLTGVGFYWKNSGTNNEYKVQIATNISFASPIVDKFVNGYTFYPEDLEASTKYYWRIYLTNDSREGVWSDIRSFTTGDDSIEGETSNLKSPDDGKKLSSEELIFSWDPVPEAEQYFFQISTDQDFETTNVDTLLSVTTIGIENLDINHEYTWRVSPILESKTGLWSDSRSFKLLNEEDISATVTLSSPANNSNSQPLEIDFEWEPLSDASEYSFQLSEHVDFSVAVIDTVVSENTLTVGSLAFAQNYFWRVMPVSETKNTDWSDIWSLETIPEIVDSEMVTLLMPEDGKSVESYSISFEWEPLQEAEKYQYQLSTGDSFESTLIDTVITSTSIEFDHLEDLDDYIWRVSPILDTKQKGNWSDPQSFSFRYVGPTVKLVSPQHNADDLSSEITFEWEKVNQFDEYRFQLSMDKDFSSFVKNSAVEGTSLTHSGLDYDSVYYWRVQVENNRNQDFWSKRWTLHTKSSDNDPEQPDDPKDPEDPEEQEIPVVRLSSPDNNAENHPTEIDFQWRSEDGYSSYQFQLSESLNFSSTVEDRTLEGTSYNYSDLNFETTYYWRVQVEHDESDDYWSDARSFTTEADENDLPTVRLSSPDNNAEDLPAEVTFEWNNEEGFEEYQFQLSSSSNFNSLIENTTVDNTEIEINSLEYGTTYHWRVQVQNDLDDDFWSNSRSFTTISDESPEMGRVTLTSPSNDAEEQPDNLTLEWNSMTGAENYRIMVGESDNFSNAIIDETVTENSFDADGLEAGTTYYWGVRAQAGDDNGEWSETWSFTVETDEIPEMGRVTLTTPSNDAEGQPDDLTFEWNSMTGAENYRIMVDESNDFNNSIIDETVTDASFTANELEPGTTYYWGVRAQAGDDIGEWSETWTFTTESSGIDQVSLSSPSDGASNQPTSMTLSWQNLQNVDEYRVQLATDNSFSNTVDDENIFDTLFNTSSLSNNQTYYWRVRGVVGNESGEWSSVSQFTTEGSSSPPPNSGDFVSTRNGNFVINGDVFRFAGTNAYYLPNYEKLNAGVVNRAFNVFEDTGIEVIRMWAFYDGFDCGYSKNDSNENVIQTAPGEYSERALRDLDRVIAKGKERGIRFILPLVNYWDELGGICQYNTWAGASNPSRNMDFFINNSDTQRWFRDYIEMLLNRVNTETGVAYKDEPAIFAWQIMNEGRNSGQNPAVLRDWYREIAQFIKSIDSNHLVSTGEEGFDEGTPSEYSVDEYSNTYVLRAQEGTSYIMNTSIPEIDFGSFHWYPGDWGFGTSVSQDLLNAQSAWIRDHKNIARDLGKPTILGEYGFAGWGDQRVEDIYDDIYRVAGSSNLDGSLLWQLTADNEKCYEFGGNICYPGGRDDATLYNRFRNFVQSLR